jgi:C-terminal processing protease CtpA/Prc
MRKVCVLILSVVFAIHANAQTKQQIENQITFAKLYGYVRYFHPSDEAAAIDWDKFAIYGVSKINNCTDRHSLKQALTDLFTPIAPTLQIADENDNIVFNKQQLIPPSLNGYKTIAWQHVGVGSLKYKEMPFQSARTNRDVYFLKFSPNAGTSLFGLMRKGINVIQYQNKQFILKGRAKLAAGPGTGHFWARVDKLDKSQGFFNNMFNNPITGSEWKDFEVKGTIDSAANELWFGVFLEGTGDFLVDNISVSIKDGDTSNEIYTNNFNLIKTGITIKDPLSDEEIKGPIADYYSHRIIEDKNLPGEKWAEIKSTTKYPAAPTGKWEKHTTLFKTYPKVGEYIHKSIGGGLKISMPISLYGDGKSTYPTADILKLTKLKNDLNLINLSTTTGDSLTTRVADIVITWNLFQHFFSYLDVIKTDWQKELSDALVSANQNQSAEDFHKTLKKFTAKLQDAHVTVNWTNDKSYFYPPISWAWIENKLVITQVFDSSVDLKKGDIVTAINDEDPKDYFTQKQQYISAATIGSLINKAETEILTGNQGSSLQLSYLDADNKAGKVRLKRGLIAFEYFKLYAVADTIKPIGKDITYINMGLANMKAIDKILPQLQKSKAIICDFRNCMIDNDNNHFIEYLLTQKDTAAHWMKIPQRIYPDQQQTVGYVTEGFELKPAKPHLSAKIIFIVDASDYSWAESYMSIIDHYKLATIVGQPTGGTNGDVDRLNLPGGYIVSYSGLKVTQLDGSKHHGVGTKPNIYVERTIKGVRENKDEFLEKALDVANK